MNRTQVLLTDEERGALWALAQSERRSLGEMAEIFVRAGLEQLGLVSPPPDSTTTKPMQPQQQPEATT